MHESIKDEFERKIKIATEKIKVRFPTDEVRGLRHGTDNTLQLGSTLAEDTWQGPQVSEIQYNRIMEHIRIGKEEDKARVLTGGERWGTEGYYIKPTVFVDIKPSALLPIRLTSPLR